MLQGCMGLTALSSNAPGLYRPTSLSSNAPGLYGAYGSVQQCSRAVWGLRLMFTDLNACLTTARDLCWESPSTSIRVSGPSCFPVHSQSVRKDFRYRASTYQMRRCSNADSAVTFTSATNLTQVSKKTSSTSPQFESERVS
ncbi:hypothetical protein ACOMHN_022564 [Nucella lapillus]